MTIREAIERADALKPNAFSRSEKVCWLAELDGRVAVEIMNTHADSQIRYTPYTDDTDGMTTLLVPPPYDDIYITWLNLKKDLYNREISGYNNGMAMFNSQYADFANFWNRTHFSFPRRLRYFNRRRPKCSFRN